MAFNNQGTRPNYQSSLVPLTYVSPIPPSKRYSSHLFHQLQEEALRGGQARVVARSRQRRPQLHHRA